MSLARAVLVIVSFGILACEYFSQQQFELNVNVNNSEAAPIEAANVLLDGESLGQTSATGAFNIQIKTSNKAPLKIEVKKESSEFYFAPYYQTINPEELKDGRININAILFSVPKSQKIITESAGSEKNIAVDTNSKDEIAFENGQKEVLPSLELEKEKVEQKNESTRKDETAPLAKESTNLALIKDVEVETLPILVDENKSLPPEVHKAPLIEEKSLKFLFYVSSDKGPITGAKIIIKEEGSVDNVLCTTNQNGRCHAKFRQEEGSAVIIVVKSEQHITQEVQIKLSEGGKKRIVLERGFSLDVATYVRRFDHASSLQGVKVFVDEKLMGTTNSSGFFTSILPFKKDQMLKVRLESKDYLPNLYNVDLVVGGPLFIERYFTPKTPPKVHVSIVPTLPAGEVTEADLSNFFGQVDGLVYESLNSRLFAKNAFVYFSKEKVDQGLTQAQISISKISENGWRNTSIANQLDALIIPTIEMSNPKKLSLNFVNRDGKVLHNSQTILSEVENNLAIDRAIKELSEKVIKNFPFEGAITRVEANNVWINIGSKSLRGIRPKDEVEIYSTQVDAFGQKRDIVKIAVEEVFDVREYESHIVINSELPPRTFISVGDLVVTRPRVHSFTKTKQDASSKQEILVLDHDSPKSENRFLGQVNVYLNEAWLGATNEYGKLQITKKLVDGDSLRLVKPGYGVLQTTIDQSGRNKLEFDLKRNTALLNVDTVPGALDIYVDDVKVGTSSMNKTIQVSGKFVNLKIKAPKGFIDFNRIVEVSGSEINLGKSNKIFLEKDIMAEAQALIAEKKISDAIKVLSEVKSSHSDYLNAWHLRGDLLLTKLDSPFEAAKSFGVVTSSKEVKNFNNKKYIASHINEGIALVKAAIKFQENKDQIALPTLVKASTAFENVQPYLHFISKDRYEEAVLSVSYYKALSQHLIWVESKDDQMKDLARKSWQQHNDHLESFKNSKSSTMKLSFKESADTYMRQLTLSSQEGKL